MDSIEQVRQLNIVDVIQKYIPLTKNGVNYTCNCPFHDEKTSSFVVSPSKNIYKCFGCGEAGDGISFVQKLKLLDFIDAIEEISGNHHIAFERKNINPAITKKHEVQKRSISVNQIALEFFKFNVKKDRLANTYIENRFSKESIEKWGIGFAPDGFQNLYDHLKSKEVLYEVIIESTLIKESEKNSKPYDFFRNRIMFPIRDERDRLVGFSGRVYLDSQKEDAKYINSSQSALFEKSQILYGLNHAKKSIQNKGFAYVVEGQTDVISMHEIELNNTVAGLGTSFTKDHMYVLNKYTDKLVMIFDGDSAGQKAWVTKGKDAILIGYAVDVVFMPEKEDPGSFFKIKEDSEQYIANHKFDYLIGYAKKFFAETDDTDKKSKAINFLADILSSKTSDVRELYYEQLKGIVKPIKALKDKVKGIDQKTAKEELDAKEEEFSVHEEDLSFLPKGVDPQDFLKYTFYEHKNIYYFKTKESIVPTSNFVMKPLFHIKSINDSRRLYEIKNVYNHTEVIDIEQAAMISLQMFRKVVESRGNYLWEGNDIQFMKLKRRLYDNTQTCDLIEHLGWQPHGFYAFSNGIFDGEFTHIDKNGIVEFKKNFYFLPALSSIYVDDLSTYVNERKFIYKESKLSIYDWSVKFIEVYGLNAKLALPFVFASLFRDFIFSKFKMFPILNLFGPPGTGKSQMARSLMYWFGDAQDPYNIFNGTKVGLSEHISEFSNAMAWIDEYKNNIDYDKIEMLKSSYDGVGRKKGSIDKGAKSKTTKIQQAVLLSGQEMPTADVALLKRVILIQFNKSEYSDSEKDNYNTLKEIEQKGLSHFTAEVVKYRKEIENFYITTFEDTLREYNERLRNKSVEDRILRNTVSVAAVYKLISKYINLPLTYKEYVDITLINIVEQSDFILNAKEISVFWNIYNYLFEKGDIINGIDFKIMKVGSLNTDKGEKKFEEPKNILFVKMAKVYNLYASTGKQTGQSVLPETTLKYYLATSPEFIATKNKVRFDRSVTSAFCFDYDALNINLIKLSIDNNDNDDIEEHGHLNNKVSDNDSTGTPF